MKTPRRFIEEDDMGFDEAAESAVAKRKLLLNRLMQKKLLPDDDDEDEVEETWISDVTLIRVCDATHARWIAPINCQGKKIK